MSRFGWPALPSTKCMLLYASLIAAQIEIAIVMLALKRCSYSAIGYTIKSQALSVALSLDVALGLGVGLGLGVALGLIVALGLAICH